MCISLRGQVPKQDLYSLPNNYRNPSFFLFLSYLYLCTLTLSIVPELQAHQVSLRWVFSAFQGAFLSFSALDWVLGNTAD